MAITLPATVTVPPVVNTGQVISATQMNQVRQAELDLNTNVVALSTGAASLVHTHAGADIVSGVVATARLGTGTPDNTKYLRGDGAWIVAFTSPSLVAPVSIVSAAAVPLVVFLNNGRTGIGTGSPGALLDVFNLTAGIPAIRGVTTATTGTNYAIQATAVTSGSAANTGVYVDADGATSNIGVRIVTPSVGPNNWAIYSDSPAKILFGGRVGINAPNPRGARPPDPPSGAAQPTPASRAMTGVGARSRRRSPTRHTAAPTARNPDEPLPTRDARTLWDVQR